MKTMTLAKTPPSVPAGYMVVRTGIVELLNAARQAAARSVNALMTASYWEIGRRIVEAEQKGKRRAGYGEQLIERLSADLTQQFGRGFSPDNLENMRSLFLAYPVTAISETLSRISGGALDGLPNKIMAANYKTVLPDAEVLQKELEKTRCAQKPNKK
jgi:DUF1016 N-terminal domain